MHASALQSASEFFAKHPRDSATVVEIGSQIVNASIRDVCPKHYIYVGIDYTAGNVYWDTTGSGIPSGSNTQVQFNDSGSFGGDSLLTFDKDTNTLTTANLTVNDTAVINTNSITIGDASLNTIITPTLLDLGGQISVNDSVGSPGQVLTSNGSGANAYWSSVVGSAGAQGTTGAQGANGTQGIQGITGPIAGSDTQLIFNDGGVAGASFSFL